MKNSNGMNHKSFSYIDIHTHLNFAAFDPVRSREGSQRASASNGVEEKTKDKKGITKTPKESFKVWKN